MIVLQADSDNSQVTEIRVSANYTSVFFSQKEVDDFLDSLLNKDGSPPAGLSIVFVLRKLKTPKTKNEIKNATPKELKEWIVI
ncbi:MAG: hypothetical protein IIA83_00150 [Thaumarchaeota archaeon]|nr:hypothetical protein [Nitrososphaerota archaeon]